MIILIHNLQNTTKINQQYVKKVVRKTLKANNFFVNSKVKKNTEMNIVFVDNKYIKKLNKKYLNRNCPTDVISFLIGEGDMFGDVFISVERAKKQAKEQNCPLKEELTLLVVHGVLHLLGYDHMTKKENLIMRRKESNILQACLDLD
ncbi:rRNA maturation RNase YbeY [bacterium]|nr:rRNA maturation RNase YbeY [bacterium]